MVWGGLRSQFSLGNIWDWVLRENIGWEMQALLKPEVYRDNKEQTNLHLFSQKPLLAPQMWVDTVPESESVVLLLPSNYRKLFPQARFENLPPSSILQVNPTLRSFDSCYFNWKTSDSHFRAKSHVWGGKRQYFLSGAMFHIVCVCWNLEKPAIFFFFFLPWDFKCL